MVSEVPDFDRTWLRPVQVALVSVHPGWAVSVIVLLLAKSLMSPMT